MLQVGAPCPLSPPLLAVCLGGPLERVDRAVFLPWPPSSLSLPSQGASAFPHPWLSSTFCAEEPQITGAESRTLGKVQKSASVHVQRAPAPALNVLRA